MPKSPLTLDQALIALMIAAMNANEHVSAEEAARAHHTIWSMRRFRRKSGEAVGRLIATVRKRLERDGTQVVMDQAVRAIPARLRPAALAVTADLMLVDGTLQREERRFLTRLATDLKVPPGRTVEILAVIQAKNSI
jgi:tellurite resistance protein